MALCLLEYNVEDPDKNVSAFCLKSVVGLLLIANNDVEDYFKCQRCSEISLILKISCVYL